MEEKLVWIEKVVKKGKNYLVYIYFMYKLFVVVNKLITLY